jgi:hypothetical protein
MPAPKQKTPAPAKPRKPAPRTSQSGYGHPPNAGGSTTPQGSRKNQPNKNGSG